MQLHVRDVQRAEKLTELMKRSHLDVPEEYVDDILKFFVEDGDCIGLESSLAKLVPSEFLSCNFSITLRVEDCHRFTE